MSLDVVKMNRNHTQYIFEPMANIFKLVPNEHVRVDQEIIIPCFSERFQNISIYNTNFMPLVYPFIHPDNSPGWYIDLKKMDPTLQREDNSKGISLLEYYKYQLFVRKDNKFVFKTGEIFVQYVTDMYLHYEATRIKYYRNNQHKFRSELYKNCLEETVILPDSHIGSPRYYKKMKQKAYDVVNKYGLPSLHITITCNRLWLELQKMKAQVVELEHRPDVEVRAFHSRLQSIIKDITGNELFGDHLAWLSSVEFQQDGTPHCNFSVILDEIFKPISAEMYDEMVCAEFPNEETQKELYDIVCKHQVNEKCGEFNPEAPCMVNGKCSQGFPKVLQEETTFKDPAHVKYRRRFSKEIHTINGIIYDNSWIIPYNPFLSQKKVRDTFVILMLKLVTLYQ